MKWLTEEQIDALAHERRALACFEIETAHEARELHDLLDRAVRNLEPHKWPSWANEWIKRCASLAGLPPEPEPRTRGSETPCQTP